MKVALIATGDEVVSGQILNTNASFLASRLSECGVELVGHYAVLDRAEDLLELFDFLQSKKGVDLAITIGGLGPTRDDLTRQVIADFFKVKLVLNESIWTSMKCGLTQRLIQPRKGHKWQAFFPSEAKIFKNSKGTAQSFMTSSENFRVVALPGPPSELESVLEEGGLLDWFNEQIHSDIKLRSWQCINTPESELAHKVELALEGCSYQVGYRASPPITEVKLWVDEKDPKSEDWVLKLDEVCKKNLYSKDGFSYIDKVLNSVDELYFVDRVTKGRALEEIKKSVSKENFKKLNYAYGEHFSCEIKNKENKETMTFYKKEEDYFLDFRDQSFSFSLEGVNVFRSKKSSLFALLMLFKELN